MKNTDLAGRRFGMLTVIGDSGERDRTSVLWRCKCDCGGETLAKRHQLTSGAVTNCGCVPKKRTVFIGAEDLTGRQFGDLTVLRRVENDKNNQTCWLCQCSCGNLHTVAAKKLKTGSVQSCGCRRQRVFYGKDLTGQQFGRLTALYLVKSEQPGINRKRVIWHCRCECGNEIDVTADNLLSGLTQSCGCISHELRVKFVEQLHYAEDTCVERLIRAQKNETENEAGFRGLALTKTGTYRVGICFQKTRYYLGTYKSFEKAVQARLDAEKFLHAGFVSAYQRWQEWAEADPEWAEGNPFFYKVQQVKGEFEIVTNAPEYVIAESLLRLKAGRADE